MNAPPCILVHGQPIPGPFGLRDSPSAWVKDHWDTSDQRDPWEYWPWERWHWPYWDHPENVGALPQVLFEESWGDPTAYNVLFRAADGLSGHQKEAIAALPIPRQEGKWGRKPVLEDLYLEPWWNGGKDIYLFGVQRDNLHEVIEGLVEILSWSDCDIDYAPISDEWAVAIYNGVHPTRPERYNNDQSRLVCGCAAAMWQAGMAEWEIRSVMKNPKYGISEHVRKNGADRVCDRVFDLIGIRYGKA